MLHWLRVMSHPDGDIAFFNDAALGIAPDHRALAAYGDVLGLVDHAGPLGDIEALPESGYLRLAAGPAVLIADAAPIGPDYVPGHAHADTLSFELSLEGRRVLVNGGTSTYDDREQRRRERGTAMHNTVEVDGLDSSEAWAAFRVARRARPFGVRWGRDGETLWLEAAHDGYRRLPGRVSHHRRWELLESRLLVMDRLEGRFATAAARFRFSPEFSAVRESGSAGELNAGTRAVRWKRAGHSGGALVPGTWHPHFGATEPCLVLEMRFAGTEMETLFSWD
jgi:uncharacterized heparinase superfamily protein